MWEDFKLTDDNYYTCRADRAYMSCSQYDSYISCEAAALAKEQGFYVPTESKALELGKYFHAAMEGEDAFESYCLENAGKIYKKNGDKYADYANIDNLFQSAYHDKTIKKFIDMEGQNEVSFTGKLFGLYPWKIRLDKFIPKSNIILDWKTLANLYETTYSPELGEKVPFTVSYGYYRRAAVYLEIVKQSLGLDVDPIFLLVCLTKQDPPDKAIVAMNERQFLDYELDKLRVDMARIWEVKSGMKRPLRCGKCEYCRKTKQITGIMEAHELFPNDRKPLEQEYTDIYEQYRFDDVYSVYEGR